MISDDTKMRIMACLRSQECRETLDRCGASIDRLFSEVTGVSVSKTHPMETAIYFTECEIEERRHRAGVGPFLEEMAREKEHTTWINSRLGLFRQVETSEWKSITCSCGAEFKWSGYWAGLKQFIEAHLPHVE